MTRHENRGVDGTVGAFNFIRRVGFPGTIEVVSGFATIAILSSIISLPINGENLGATLILPLSVVVFPSILGEALVAYTILRQDDVLDFRRLMGMEIISWLLLVICLPFSAIIGNLLSNSMLWQDPLYLLITISLPIRFLTINSILSIPEWRKMVASALPPSLSIIALSILGFNPSVTDINSALLVRGIFAFVLGTGITITGIWRIVRSVEESGSHQVRDSPLTLFRAFLKHWLRSDPSSLEIRLSALGTRGTIEGSVLSFSGPKGSIGCIVASNFHPGPYRDLGSAGLPSRLKATIEKSVGGTAEVPHGISNHQLNIVSRTDVDQVIEKAVENYPRQTSIVDSTPMVRTKVDEAQASGQLFGNIAFLTLTLSPTDMEDLPARVAIDIDRAAQTLGLVTVIADAHNSLSHQTSITSDQAQKLVRASIKVLEQLSVVQKSEFRVGSSSDSLAEFSLEDGIGPGGLSTLVVQNGSQAVAYLTIDGNNMLTGVREAILEDLRGIGISDGEIMTTDTHLVTGLARSRLGYYPVGAHLDLQLLTQKARASVQKALAGIDSSKAGFSKFTLDVGILGTESFQEITGFVGRIARRIARQFYVLELLVLASTFVVLLVP